ncbi:MAG: ABC transporter permease [Deltaproteobacteria bacterium]|nr:ABC transporter permease [Deltaproteobacteria bacterium]
MGATESKSGGGEATLTVDRPEHETLRVRLAGEWRLTSSRPDPDSILAEAERQPTRRLVFDASGIESWDTAILIFLDRLETLAAERKLEVDRRGLPDGVERLLALTAATTEKEGARAKTVPQNWLAQVGTFTVSFIGGSKAFLTFLGEVTLSFLRLVRGRASYRRSDFFYVLQETGAQALPIVTLIAFLVGLIMAFVGAVQLQPFGATLYVANGVAIAMAREMAAMMTAIIMAGRTGAAFAAQLGTMKVTEEIDAVATMGLDPIDYLVLPRMLALSLMMPLLAVYANAVGILGGATVGLTMLDLSPVLYWQQTVQAVTLTHFATGLVKAVVFGVIVAVSGCLRGMQCGNSASAVGESATSAVVTCIVLIVITDGLFAVIFNVLGV